MYAVSATRSCTYTRAHPRMRVPTRLRTRTRAGIGGAAAYNGSRCIDHSPSASHHNGPGRKGGTYRVQRSDTRRVPRPDVRVERIIIRERLRAEQQAVDGRRPHVSCVCVHVHDVSVGYISRRTYPLAHV